MQLFVKILFGFTIICAIQCYPKVVINEVNFIDPKFPAKGDYIELKQVFGRGDKMSLKGYKLIGLSCKSKSGTIDTVATLWNFGMNDRGFFTIGGSEVTRADVKMPHEMIKTPNSYSKVKKHSLISIFFVGDTEIRAIGLLYGEQNSFKEIILNEKTQFLSIDQNLMELLKKYLIDLVVLSVKAQCDECKFIERIYNDFAGKKYILREVQANRVNINDISLNRCTIETAGFLPDSFKLGNPTPGDINDCNGPHFILEQNILEAAETDQANANIIYTDELDNEFDESCTSENQPTCTSSISRSEYSQTTSHSIAESIHQLNVSSTASTCTQLMLSPDSSVNTATLNQENKRKRNMGVDTDYSEENEWSTTKYFR